MDEKNNYDAQRRYDEKNGLIAKSYRLNKDVVKAFADACKASGVSQSGQLTKMMTEFIEETRQQDD